MAINVTLGEAKTQEQEKDFPKFMIVSENVDNKGMIVLFKSKGVGTVIKGGKSWRIGEYCDAFFMKHFTDYNEPITLQNK